MSVDRVTLQHGDPDAAHGVWKGGRFPSGRTAIISCPKCGFSASLRDHSIDDNGDVNPSLVCPGEGCGFHEWITLAGWEPLPGHELSEVSA